jgi:uncharacterized protein YuzE
LFIAHKEQRLIFDSLITEDEVIVRYENNEIIGLSILNASKRTDLNIGVI